MKTLTDTEIQVVSGAGAIADAFSNAGSGYGAAVDGFSNGSNSSTVGGAIGKGFGSVVEGGLGIAGSISKGFNNSIGQVAPPIIGATGGAAAAVAGAGIGAAGTAFGNAVGGIIKGIESGINPIKIG
ncbi:hypothetical protein [Rosenbergiella nectarea]|uniref:hypothetical protein n=1 Tax=Rosenbergiella nectarea TaxID=988801 RepID=UPI001BD9D7B3|nr:hypothetical protein [Rosenbergiella nectarea]MBT0730087.1 hypothetical protein [Rosenbergiella nectarea subsp. apis]